MSAITDTAPRGGALSLAVRYALRELRSGLRGFYVFIACIALGVMAIAGVGSVAGSLNEGLDHQGRTLLGGDASFALIQREATRNERAFLDSSGKVSVAALMRAMARSPSGEFALVDLKAVDGNYPMLGEIRLAPQIPMADLLAQRDGAFGAGADAVLLARLGLKIGDRVTVGSTAFEIRSVVDSEPDKLAGGVGLGPRLLVSETALRATGLLQPGTLVRWVYRLQLPDAALDERTTQTLVARAEKALPEAGWEVRTRSNASPQLERNITRFTQFLTLVGLAALLVGGVGVANAIKSHLDERRDVIATFKALGATGREVFTIYLVQVLMLAILGSLIGLAIGAALPFIIVGLFGKILPLPIEATFHAGELALSFLYGLLTALAFGLWPLGRVHDVPVAALFREGVTAEFHWPRRRYLALMAAVIALLIAVAIRSCLRQARRRRLRHFINRGIRPAARHCLRADAAGAEPAAPALHHAAAGDRQHPSPRRADAVGGDVARSRPRRAGDDHADRRQPAPAVHGGAAGARAVVLFHRHSCRGSHAVQRLPETDRPGRRRGNRADAARTHRRREGRQGRRPQALLRRRMGAAKRPRPDLHRRGAARLEGRRRHMVGRQLRRPATGVAGEEDRRRHWRDRRR